MSNKFSYIMSSREIEYYTGIHNKMYCSRIS